jgi:biopolymer transport protein ExbD
MMSVRCHCSKCSATHSVHERLRGRAIRCPSCDETIQVPLRDSGDFDTEVGTDAFVSAEMVEDFETIEPISEPMRSEGIPQKNPKGSGVVKNGNGDEIEDENKDEAEDEVEEISFEKRELPKDDMDMTPMVDVTFLLLIFFMITASFSKEKVIEEPPALSDKPSSMQKEEPDKLLDTVRVQVDEFNAYTIILPGGEDRQASSKQDLLIALDDARKEMVTGANDNALKMAVEAHVDSIHAAVVAAMDAGRDKGFSSFQVTVVEEFD